MDAYKTKKGKASNYPRRKSSQADRELERRKMRQEIYLDAIDDLTALRDHYRAEVRMRLEEKVRKQRKSREELKAKKEAIDSEKALAHGFKAQLPKSSNVDDTQFLDKIALSKSYQIISIRSHLEKNNELDKRYKIDEFNRIILMPGVLRKCQKELAKGRAVDLAGIRAMACIEEKEADHSPEHAKGEHVGETTDDDVFDDVDISAEMKNKLKHLKMIDSRKNVSINPDNVEAMFPSIPYPKLVAINRNFDSPEPNADQAEKELNTEKARQDTENRRKMVQQMFQKSQSYDAATERLVTKYNHLSFSTSENGSSARDILVSLPRNQDVVQESTRTSSEQDHSAIPVSSNLQQDSFIDKYLESLSELHVANRYMSADFYDGSEAEQRLTEALNLESQPSRWKGRVHTDEALRRQILGIKDEKREQPKLAPLTMSALEETTPIKIVKGPPLTWINPELQPLHGKYIR